MGENEEIPTPTVGRIVHVNAGREAPLVAIVAAASWIGPLHADLAIFDPQALIETTDGYRAFLPIYGDGIAHVSIAGDALSWDWPPRA